MWTGLATLLPVVAVGWCARAIEDIRTASREAVSRVERSVQAVASAREFHEAVDAERHAALRQRVETIEAWKDGRLGRLETAPPPVPVVLPVTRQNPRGLL